MYLGLRPIATDQRGSPNSNTVPMEELFVKTPEDWELRDFEILVDHLSNRPFLSYVIRFCANNIL